jgi:hypothetical protein
LNQTDRDYPELAVLTHRFSAGTRGRITRALLRVLRGHSYQSAATLLLAVRDASRELRVQGLGDHAVLTTLGVLVEETGRACGAGHRSLVSGEPRWLQVRAHVLELASGVLTRDTNNALTPKRAVSSIVRAAS